MKLPLPRTLALGGAVALVAGIGACSASDSSDEQVSVVASFYPLQYVAEQVGGDHVAVQNLTAAGAESHNLELGADQVAEVVDADVVLYLEGFQPAVDEAVAAQAPEQGMNVAESTEMLDSDAPHDDESGDHDHGHDHDHGGSDPHVWLDPTKTADIAEAVAQRLKEIDPGNAEAFADNAAGLDGELAALDEDYSRSLDECQSRDIVTSHAAFGYLAARYDLHQVAVSGLSPETEPATQALQEVSDYVNDHDVTTVFHETLVSPAVAETISDETGAETAVLDPLEGLAADSDGDYMSIMESNRATLEEALVCQ